MTPSQLWYAAAVVLFLLEMITPGFVLANIALSALAAGISAELGGSLEWQVGLFAVVGLLSFLTLRPLLRRKHSYTESQQPSDAEELLGRVVLVTEMITSDGTHGHVQVDGHDWHAISLRATEINLGAQVRICGIEATTLVVEEVEQT